MDVSSIDQQDPINYQVTAIKQMCHPPTDTVFFGYRLVTQSHLSQLSLEAENYYAF